MNNTTAEHATHPACADDRAYTIGFSIGIITISAVGVVINSVVFWVLSRSVTTKGSLLTISLAAMQLLFALVVIVFNGAFLLPLLLTCQPPANYIPQMVTLATLDLLLCVRNLWITWTSVTRCAAVGFSFRRFSTHSTREHLIGLGFVLLCSAALIVPRWTHGRAGDNDGLEILIFSAMVGLPVPLVLLASIILSVLICRSTQTNFSHNNDEGAFCTAQYARVRAQRVMATRCILGLAVTFSLMELPGFFNKILHASVISPGKYHASQSHQITVSIINMLITLDVSGNLLVLFFCDAKFSSACSRYFCSRYRRASSVRRTLMTHRGEKL